MTNTENQLDPKIQQLADEIMKSNPESGIRMRYYAAQAKGAQEAEKLRPTLAKEALRLAEKYQAGDVKVKTNASPLGDKSEAARIAFRLVVLAAEDLLWQDALPILAKLYEEGKGTEMSMQAAHQCREWAKLSEKEYRKQLQENAAKVPRPNQYKLSKSALLGV